MRTRKTPKPETMWAVWGDSVGFYCGTWLTRRAAVYELNRFDAYQRERVRVIKVKLVPVLPKRRKATKQAR